MPLADIVRQHLMPVAAASGAAIGVAIGLFLPIHAAPPLRGEALQWNLPSSQAIRRFETTQYQSLIAAGFWNTQTPARGGANAAKGWTLKAIMTSPIAQVAVGIPGKNTQAWVRVGGSLPDGSVLASVSRDAIWYELDGCRRMKRLYANTGKQAASAKEGAEDACIGQSSHGPAARPPRPASSAGPGQPGATPSNGK